MRRAQWTLEISKLQCKNKSEYNRPADTGILTQTFLFSQAYLSSLGSKTKKPQGDIDWSKLAEMSDVSVEEEDEPKPAVTTSSDFLKKKKPTPAAQSKDLKKPKVSKAAPTKSKATGQVGAASKSKSSALNKAAAFTAKYAQSASRDKFGLSDSDLDLDISMDEDVREKPLLFCFRMFSSSQKSTHKPKENKKNTHSCHLCRAVFFVCLFCFFFQNSRCKNQAFTKLIDPFL